MKIDWDEECTFGGAFDGASIIYLDKDNRQHSLYLWQGYSLINWYNAILRGKYEIIAIKNVNAKKLFKWAGIDDYPNSLPGHLQNTREV